MPKCATQEVLIDAHEAARLLCVRINTLRWWEKIGKIPAGRKVSPRGKRWDAAEIQALAEKLGSAA